MPARCKCNAQYASKRAQNDFKACIQDRIIQEIKAQQIGAKYGLIADEVRDEVNVEQLEIVLRYGNVE